MAHLEYARGTAQMEVSRDRRGLQIRSQPIRVNIDTFEARSSIVPTTAQSIQQGAAQGQRAAYEATAVLAQEGRMMMEAKIDQDVIPSWHSKKPWTARSAWHPVSPGGGPRYLLDRRGNEHPL